jgi:polyferredoxin
VVVTAGAALPREDTFRPRGTVLGSRRGRWRALVLILVHVAAILHFAHWRVAGETLAPMEPSEAMWTLEFGYVNAGFLVLGLSIVATAVLGRFFCGWLCHFVAYQDLCGWLLRRLGLRPRPVRSRLLVFVPLGAAFYMFLWPTLSRWWGGGDGPRWQWELTTSRFWETFPGPGIALLTVLVCGFLLVWWLGAKGFCAYGCPYGAFFGLADKVAPGRIRVTDACSGCGHCTAVCTSNVRVHEEVGRHRMVVDSGCMKTMDCVSACPNDALYFGFGRPPLGRSHGARRARPQADFSWGEELMMAAVFLGALWAFRSAYNLVPFLLALGLGIVGAIAAVTLWRLGTRAELKFQNGVLKAGGRSTRLGFVALVASLGYLALGLHTGVVRWQTMRGEEVALSTIDRILPQPERRARLDESAAWLRSAEGLGLLPDSALQKTFGLVQRDRGELDDAERRLRRALELHPHASWPAAAIPLADLLAKQRRPAEAEQVLRGVLAERPEIVAAAVMLGGVLAAQQRYAEASEVLAEVVARHPDHRDARMMLDAVDRLK